MADGILICTSCWEEDCVCDYERFVPLDAGIADAIISLNLKGYRTSYSCEGHIAEDDGSDHGNIMDIYFVCPNHRFDELPEGFSYPRGKNIGISIERFCINMLRGNSMHESAGNIYPMIWNEIEWSIWQF